MSPNQIINILAPLIMKSKSYRFIGAVIFIAINFLLLSCLKNELPFDEHKGVLSLSVSMEIVEIETGSSLKSALVEDYKVEIFKVNQTEPYLTFDHSSDIPDPLELPVGEYYVTASSGLNPAAAFESPYYFGQSANFTILSDETSQVQITCSLANIMVSVVYSDQVKDAFSDFNTLVSNASGSLTFGKDEERNGFFNSGPLSVVVSLEYSLSDGSTKTKTLSGTIADPVHGKHYQINIDASLPDGSSSISITLNDDVETVIYELTDDDESSTVSESGIQYGDLLITEIMYNPSDTIGEPQGEWIEVFNNSQDTINLIELVIRRGSNDDFHQINSDVELIPGAFAVIARTDTATANVDYVYDITLKNSGDEEIFLSEYGTNGTDGFVICSVPYLNTGFPSTTDGKAIQLAPSIKDADQAKDGSNWCLATETYSTGDYGTPGAINSACGN